MTLECALQTHPQESTRHCMPAGQAKGNAGRMPWSAAGTASSNVQLVVGMQSPSVLTLCAVLCAADADL